MTSLTVFQRGTQVVRLVQVVYARHPMVEWGQDDADSTMLGDTALGCTQTELQVADFLEHGRILSLDRISALAGYRDSDRAAGHGMSTNQLKTAIEALELPLEVVYDLPYDELIHSVREMGPALVSCQYAWYPQKHDVNGATGEPNGYCDRAGGRNDLTFERGHQVTFLRGQWRSDLRPHQMDVWVHDPDHGSPARPSLWPVDRMRGHQAERLYESGVRNRADGRIIRVAAVRTRPWNGVRAA